MKLELKHLAPYQEHKVKLTDHLLNKYNISYLSTKRIAFIDINGFGEVQKLRWEYAGGKIKPILRPLSEIEENEIFISVNQSYRYPDFGHFERSVLSGHADYNLIMELISDHYDVFGLIEKGLAIDINTIEK